LIRIFTERSAKPVINRASLLERYIEINLEKFAPNEILSDTFDFHNKTDLLSDIAEKMCREEEYTWSDKQAVDAIQEYLDRYDLNYSPIALLNYFIRSRILESSEEGIGFRLKAFLEFFAAKRMVDDPKFKAWVLDDIRYLQFEGEITCYAALTRRDSEWVSELFDRFEKNAEEVWAGTPKEVRDGSLLEDLILPQGTSSEEEVFALERRILAEELGEEGRRELLNTSSSPEANSKLVNRAELSGPGEKWTTQLNMLSAMVRHMELIPADQKSRVLDKVLENWISVLSTSIGLAPALAHQKAHDVQRHHLRTPFSRKHVDRGDYQAHAAVHAVRYFQDDPPTYGHRQTGEASVQRLSRPEIRADRKGAADPRGTSLTTRKRRHLRAIGGRG
jgi:hypothetical protein